MTAPTSPGLLFRLHVWISARLLPLRISGLSFEQVLRLAPLDAPTPYRGLPAADVIRCVTRAVRHPWLMRDRRCLRQGLLASRFLRSAGFDPELVFGVDPASTGESRLSAHCWVCLDEVPVVSDRLPGMVTIYRHGPAAAATRIAA